MSELDNRLEHPLYRATGMFTAERAQFIAGGRAGDVPLMDTQLLALAAGPYSMKDGSIDLHWQSRPAPAPHDLAALKDCLPKLMSANICLMNDDESVSLLAGVHRYGCWRACLSTEAGTRALACAILQYLDNYFGAYNLDVIAKPGVLEILNEWLQPQTPWSELPGVITVCRYMFGDSWCALSLPGDYLDSTGQFAGGDDAIELLVRNARPAFLPGLSPTQIEDEMADLPDLGSTP